MVTPLTPSEVERMIHFVVSCGVTRSDIVLAILAGSRLWGTATHRSDIDVVVVHTSHAPALQGKSAVGGKGFDVQLIHMAEFERRCQQHEPQSLLCVYVPPMAVTVFGGGGGPFLNTMRESFTIDRRQLSAEAHDMVRKDGEKAAKFLEKGDTEKAKKIWVHTHRHLMLLAEVVASGGRGLTPERFVEVSTGAGDLANELRSVYGTHDPAGYGHVVGPVLAHDLSLL